MIITCTSHQEFMQVCFDCVRNNMRFTANHDDYTITFTGGH